MSDSLLCYWHKCSNFGDKLTPFMIPKLTGKKVVYSKELNKDVYVCIGSILHQLIKLKFNPIVWGAGIIDPKYRIRPPKEIHAVRGPLTRDLLEKKHNIRCPEVYGDPAILLPSIYPCKEPKRYKLGIIPHVVDRSNPCLKGVDEDVCVINLADGIPSVISKIVSCEKTICSSLHGLIVSHAYGIPSAWVEFSNKVQGKGFKFRDYLETYGIKKYDAIKVVKKEDMKKVKYVLPEIDSKSLIDSAPFDLVNIS